MPADTLPESITLSLDLRITAFTASVTIITGVLFGLAPAWQARRVSLIGALDRSREILGRDGPALAALVPPAHCTVTLSMTVRTPAPTARVP